MRVSTCTQLFHSLFILARSWFAQRTRLWSGAAGAGGSAAGGTGGGGTGATLLGGAGVTAGAGDTGVGGARAGGAGAGDPGDGGTGARGAGGGGARAGGIGAGDPGIGGAGAGGAGAGSTGAGGTVQRQPFFIPPPPSSLPPPDSVLRQVLSLPSSNSLPPSNPESTASPVAATVMSFVSLSLVLPRLFALFALGHRVPRPPPPPVPGTHIMALRPSSVPLRIPMLPPPASSLPAVPDPESDLARIASPTVPHLLATVVTDPSIESTSASALVAELIDFAAACRLDYATSLVAESESNCPPSVGGECALDIEVLEDKHEDLSIAMDAEMVSWKSTGTYIDAVPSTRANIVDGMWIFRVLQRFGFRYSSPQSTPLPTGHSLSAPPSDESVELVGCLITSGMGLELGGRGPVVLTGHAEASWVDDLAMQRSSQGYTFSLGSSSVSWQSTRSSSVLSSSCEAEIYAGAMAAHELRWLTYLLIDLGERPRSSPQRGQLRLAYVATRANTADIFTKALQSSDHQRLSTVLGIVPTLPHLLTA
ncbi:unnamed protein product [Closterium sp. NIES-53]